MNIPQYTLQQVADAAFAEPFEPWLSARAYHLPDWKNQEYARRAVIQHALSNPALVPFLSRGIGEYTDEEIKAAAMDTYTTYGIVINSTWLRSFLAALPAAEPTPPADPEPAAQVPLGPEDVKPNAWFKMLDGSIKPLEFATPFGVAIKGQREIFTFGYLKDSGIKMNESLSGTGRWDANAWRPCSKPAGKGVAK